MSNETNTLKVTTEEKGSSAANSEIIDLNETKQTKKEEKAILPEINSSDVPIINYDDFKPIFKFEDMTDEEICNGAMNRLTQDTYFGINGLPLIACWLYVYNKARVDVDFAKKICIKSKCFTKAFEYLHEEIRSLFGGKGSQGIGVDHRQIFAILDEYYDLDDKELAEKEAQRKAKEKAKQEKNKSKSAQKAKSSPASKNNGKKEKAKENAEKAQANLFDLLGGSI